eukprot:TRINITY_DN2965_c0_g1_i1.p1 TRINITY_DN2965_c0_g1~~TRINITY_DN2965_c0_g1_i1.p1  ORF type:complete len:853 (+),score=151.22 TRINITY_DN2965_c0_g1_i1:127-2685(+)
MPAPPRKRLSRAGQMVAGGTAGAVASPIPMYYPALIHADRQDKMQTFTRLTSLQDAKKAVHRQGSPQDAKQVRPRRSSPQDTEQALPRRSSPQNAKQALPHQSSPQDAKQTLPHRSSPQDAKQTLLHQSSLLDAKQALPRQSSSQDAKQACSPQNVKQALPYQCSSHDAKQALHHQGSSQDAEQTLPHRNSLHDTKQALPRQSSSQDAKQACSPQDAKQTLPHQSSSLEAKQASPRQSSPQDAKQACSQQDAKQALHHQSSSHDAKQTLPRDAKQALPHQGRSQDAKQACSQQNAKQTLHRQSSSQDAEQTLPHQGSPQDVKQACANQITPPAFIHRQAFQPYRHETDLSSAYIVDWSDEVGSGAFGRVFRAHSRFDSNRIVAVKEVDKNGQNIEQIRSEIQILSMLDHPNVLRFFEAYEDHQSIFVVTELCAGGDLSSCYAEVRGDVKFARHVVDQVLRGLAYCHSCGVCHRDLKPENIFLLRRLGDTRDPPLRLADFGLARHLQKTPLTDVDQTASSPSRKLLRMRSIKGTPEYMAPEVMGVLNAQVNITGEDASYSLNCDIWSLGVVIYELLIGAQPYSLEAMADFVENGVPLKDADLGEMGGTEAATFVQCCLRPDPESRPSASELLASSFLTQPRAEKPQDVLRRTAKDLKRISNNVNAFMNTSLIKKAALTAAARHLLGYELYQLRELFEHFDSDRNGKIGLEEWKCCLCSLLDGKDSEWIENAFLAMDTDASGEVDYCEFLAGVMDSRLEERRELAWAAFKAFDHSDAGSLSKEDLERVLEDGSHQHSTCKTTSMHEFLAPSQSAPSFATRIPRKTATTTSQSKRASPSGSNLSFEAFIGLLEKS